MKRWFACLGLLMLLTPPAGAWRPTGWVYHDDPWALDADTGDWYWFNTADTQWVSRMDNGQWSRLPDSALASGWGFYQWPYALASGGPWHWINEVDVQWVVNMRTGAWSRYGAEPAPPDPGEEIFADFSTSMGDFTVRLDDARAPRAVASFVGLATGEKAWMDPQGNVWSNRPFYDQSIFHRVVKSAGAGIAVQGGGVARITTDTNGVVSTNFSNAGYRMPDAVSNGLAHSNGVISMANSGPNTDGSQFFITTTNVPGWDGGYTVFGHVTDGMETVRSIAAVSVQGAGSRPVEDVHLHQVVIRREGPAAGNFDLSAQGVPVVESGGLRLASAGTNVQFQIELEEQSQTLFRQSEDLTAWEQEDLGYHTNAVFWLEGTLPKAELGDTAFFHVSRVRFPIPLTAPASLRGRSFTFWWETDPPILYEVIFAENRWVQGQYRVTRGEDAPVLGAVFIGDEWYRYPYSARLVFFDDSGKEYDFALRFDPGAVTNRFTGNWRTGAGAWNPVGGTFIAE